MDSTTLFLLLEGWLLFFALTLLSPRLGPEYVFAGELFTIISVSSALFAGQEIGWLSAIILALITTFALAFVKKSWKTDLLAYAFVLVLVGNVFHNPNITIVLGLLSIMIGAMRYYALTTPKEVSYGGPPPHWFECSGSPRHPRTTLKQS